MVQNTRSEDTLLFIGLTPEVTKLKPIYKILTDFADKKQSIDISDRFNLLLFQETGPVYLNDFTFNFETALSLLHNYEEKMVRANIAGGIFTACTFCIDIYKKISDKFFRLIILTDKGSLRIPDHYVPVLENLLTFVKDIPFYIDIIRLGVNDPAEDIKLMKIAKLCGGRNYGVKSPKELSDLLGRLTSKKVIRQDTSFSDGVKSLITHENKSFFENLADHPTILITSETCSICFKKDDKTVVQCPNCDTITHMSCWAYWAKNANIGIPNIFRCHSCFNLLKLDKDFVEIVQTGKAPALEVRPERVDLVSYLREMETQRAPEIIHGQDPLELSEDAYKDEMAECYDFDSELESEPECEPIQEKPNLEVTFRQPIPMEIPSFSKPKDLQAIPGIGELQEGPKTDYLEEIPEIDDMQEVPELYDLEEISEANKLQAIPKPEKTKAEREQAKKEKLHTLFRPTNQPVIFTAAEPISKPIPQPQRPSQAPITQKNPASKPVLQITSDSAPKPTPETGKVKTLQRKSRKDRADEVKIIFCPNCASLNTSLNKTCKVCGFELPRPKGREL